MTETNLALVGRCTLGTYLVELNGVWVYEDTNKSRAEAIATFLNRGRSHGFHPALVKHIANTKATTSH